MQGVQRDSVKESELIEDVSLKIRITEELMLEKISQYQFKNLELENAYLLISDVSDFHLPETICDIHVIEISGNVSPNAIVMGFKRPDKLQGLFMQLFNSEFVQSTKN